MMTSLTKLLYTTLFLSSSELYIRAYNAHEWEPSISIASPLDDGDNGYCIDISGFGAGLNCNSLQGHSCKPNPSDTQFELYEGKYLRAVNYNSGCGAAASNGNDRACVKVNSIEMDSTLALTECNEDDELQTFKIRSVDAGYEIRMDSNDELCLVVSNNSRQAGRYLARDLYLDDCDEVNPDYKTWDIAPEPIIDGEDESSEELSNIGADGEGGDGDGGDSFGGDEGGDDGGDGGAGGDDGGDDAGDDGGDEEPAPAPIPTTTTIDWVIRAYEDETAMVGDTFEFKWEGNFHNLYIHPSGNCENTTGQIEVGQNSPASYTFTDDDAERGEVTFVCTLPGHCLAGQILKVIVSPSATTEAPETESGGGLIGLCFSGNTLVDVYGKGKTSISDLQIGDKVKIGSEENNNNIYDTVYSFGHYNPEQFGEFLQIAIDTKKEKKKIIEMSKDHLILLNDGNYSKENFVPASTLKIGDQLVTTNLNEIAVVSNIKVVRRKGVYAPFTMSGTIVVSDIVASSFVTLQENKDMVTVGGGSFLSAHKMAYLFESIHRMAYRFGISKEESYSSEGISHWVKFPREFFMALLLSNKNALGIVIQSMILISCIGVLAMLNTVEYLLYSSNDNTSSFYYFFAFVAFTTLLLRCSKKKNTV